MEVVSNNYMPGDQRLIQQIVYELKSQGIFDNFRKECIADVDTKPAYQNLRQRVEGSVASFLTQQTWSNDMNKNQIREQLRKNIHDLGFLDSGVERIVEQVVNPKINSIFLPRVEDVVYRYLGLTKPERPPPVEPAIVETRDLLPMDLEAVSPESNHNDRNESFNVSDSKMDDSTCVESLSNKCDEDESPPFEALETEPNNVTAHNENSVDSQISGYSGARSHEESNQGSDTKICQMDISSIDSQTSQNSCESRLSIVTSEETKMDISEDSQTTRDKPVSHSVNNEITNGTPVEADSEVVEKSEVISEDVNMKCEKEIEIIPEEIIKKNEEKEEIEIKPDPKDKLSKTDEKSVEKKSDSKSETKDKSKSTDKSSSRDRKDDGRHSKSSKDRSKSKSSSSKDKVSSSSSSKVKENSSSSSSHSSIKDKEHETSSSTKSKESSSSSKDKSKSKDRRDSKSSSSHKNTEKHDKDRNNEKQDKDKIKVEDRNNEKRSSDKLPKDKLEKEKSDKDKSRKEKSDKSSRDKSDKDRDDKEKSDKDKTDKDKQIKEKSNRDKDKSEKSHRDKSDKEKHSKNDKDVKEKVDKDRAEKKKERSEKDKSKSTSSSKDRSSSSSNRDKNRPSSSSSKDKMKSNHSDTTSKASDSKSETSDQKSSKGDSKSKHGDRNKSDDKSAHSSSKNSKDKKKEKQAKDDHYSSKDKKGDRRSTDRDSNDGSSSKPSHSNLINEKKSSHKATSEATSSSVSGSNDSASNSDPIETSKHSNKLQSNEVLPNVTEMQKLKYSKPKFASNFQEAIKIMKIRKQIAKLERQNQLGLSEINIQATVQNGFDDIVQPKTTKVKPKKSYKASPIPPVKSCDSPKETPSTPIKTTNLSQESWEALEARLAQEMSNINYNSYGLCDDDEDYSVSEIVISPAKDRVKLVEKSKKVEEPKKVENVVEHVEESSDIVKIDKNVECHLAKAHQEQDKSIEEVDAPMKEDTQIDKAEDPSKEDGSTNIEISKTVPEPQLVILLEEPKKGLITESTGGKPEEIPEEAHEQLSSEDDQKEETQNPVEPENSPHQPDSVDDYPQLDSPPCYYFEKPDPSVELRLQFLHDFVAQLEREVVASRNNFENCHRGVKRKREDYVDAKNNNKADYEQNTEVKKRLRPPNTAISKAIKDKTNQCTDVISNEGFSLPLSPESDISNDKKEEETVRPEKRRKSNGKGGAQRYSSDDLYKPRPSFVGTRRTRSAKNV